MTRRLTLVLGLALLVVAAVATPATGGGDRPFSTAGVFVGPRVLQPDLDAAGAGLSGSKQSKQQIENFRCTASGDPTAVVDISCNDEEFGQRYSPDNEIAVAVNPLNPDHIVAGSNDYFYRFNNSTGARQVLVPTGFFTSFDGGANWIDGQIPTRSGNGAGDPSPAFSRKHSDPSGDPNGAWVMMAQLENVAGQGGFWVAQGDVSVSHSPDGGVTWSQPVTVMMGTGTGIGPANQATFYDKEWLTVDNNPASDFYGRAYVVATKFTNGLFGSYARGPIVLSYSDDGGLTWSAPTEISGFHPTCTSQETGPAGECDEDQNAIPVVAPDEAGTLHVYFGNYQNSAEWEVPLDFDAQIMVVSSHDGGTTFDDPVVVAQREDGASDMPYSVIGRQTVWGHQIRWSSDGNIAVDPTDPNHVTVIWSDRGTANPNATAACVEADVEPPNYDPCNAGPGSDLDVFRSDSVDGGMTWGPRTLVDDGGGASQWFPWGAYRSDGSLVIAWDQDTAPAPADTFVHVLWDSASGIQALGPEEHVDVSLTHWAGQYVPPEDWPVICGPAGYTDPPVADARGKDCNVFHGDYTGLAVGPDDSVHVVWTGLNRSTTAPQIDFYTGDLHDGYAQDAMYARR
jgi:hypothetical protein